MQAPPPDRTDLLTIAAFQALLSKSTNLQTAEMDTITRKAREMGEAAERSLVAMETERAEAARVDEARQVKALGEEPEPRTVPSTQ